MSGTRSAIADADQMVERGEIFRAVVLLATNYFGRKQALDKEQKAFERDALSRIAELDPRQLESEVSSRVERLDRIACGGGTFEFEEVVLALTLRLEIALVSSIVRVVRGVDLEPSVRSCDACLLDVIEDPRNEEACRSAWHAIESRWISVAGFDADSLLDESMLRKLRR